jgi:hypothetical protein
MDKNNNKPPEDDISKNKTRKLDTSTQGPTSDIVNQTTQAVNETIEPKHLGGSYYINNNEIYFTI